MSDSHILITLDLSTNSTGYAVFNSKTKKLITYGNLKPKVSGLHKLKYPAAALLKIKDIASKVKDLVAEHDPESIVIEEVNRGINRIAQKSLDALHFFVLDYLTLIDETWITRVRYMDSNGVRGWRGKLELKLSDEDKEHNKKVRKKYAKEEAQKHIVDWKVLAQRYVNAKYGTSFDVKENEEHADICDAIAMGDAWFLRK